MKVGSISKGVSVTRKATSISRPTAAQIRFCKPVVQRGYSTFKFPKTPLKPLEEWSEEEAQGWFLNPKYAKYAKDFENWNGKELASLTKAHFHKELGILQGSSLYNSLQELKGISNFPNIRLSGSVKEMIQQVEKMLQGEFNELSAPGELKPISTSKEKLGRFFKTPLPFSDTMIDPRLFDDEVNPSAEEILQRLDRGTFYAILVGKPGAGKTRAIFDVARKYFTIYMETVPPWEERDEPTRDKSYQKLCERIIEFKQKNSDSQQIQYYVRHLILVEVTARVVLLYLLRKKYPQLTPQQFLHAQLHGAQTQLMNIVTHLLRVEIQDIRIILIQLFRLIPRIVFAVDEAGLAHEAFKDEGIWRSPQTKSNRGLLTPLINCLSLLPVSTIESSTNCSLVLGPSDIGIPDWITLVTKFCSTSEEENENVLQQRLNLDGCDLSKIPGFRYLTGSPRLRDLVLMEICKKEPTATGHSKQHVLEECVNQVVEKTRENLKERFNRALANQTETSFLARLYAATSFFEGTLTEVCPMEPGKADSFSIGLVDIGLASLKYNIINETQLVVVDEPLSVEVIQEGLRNWSPLHVTRAKLLEAVKIYGAHEGESLAAFVLKSITDKKIGTVADFAKIFGLEEATLPSWTKEAKLQYPGVEKLHHLGFPNEPTFLDFTLNTITSNPSYCSPLVHGVSRFMSPHVIAIGGINSSRFFSVLISSKLYNEKGLPVYDIQPDLLSTDWNRVYHETPEKPGITKINKVEHTRKLWDEVLMKHRTLQHAGSLRLHIILPHIEAYVASELCRVEGNDVIIYIDKKNAGLFFDPATCEILAELTATDASCWKLGNSS